MLLYKEACQHPKGGAVSMSKDNIQAVGAQILGRKACMNPEVIYIWAQKNGVDLLEQGHLLCKRLDDFVLDVLNGTVLSIS